MKTNLLYAGALVLIALVACAAPTPTPVPPTPLPPTPTAIPPTPTPKPVPPTPIPVPPTVTSTQEPHGIEIGAKVPDFSLSDATGSTVNLAEEVSKHRSVVLVFYRGAW